MDRKIELYTQQVIDNVDKGAFFSFDKTHRYSLWRIWDHSLPKVMFIGLNPSTANETEDDPTIRSICRIAKSNGYGGVYMMNCWAFVSTDPKKLQISEEECKWNDLELQKISDKCRDVVFAWGSFDIVKDRGRDKELVTMFPNAKALHVNKNGSPKHPLYCRSDIKFVSYEPPL